MPLALILLIALLAVSLGVAMHAALADRDRRVVLGRVLPAGVQRVVRTPTPRGARGRVAQWLTRRLPASPRAKTDAVSSLVPAGFDGPVPVAVYSVTRVLAGLAALTIAFAVAPRHTVAGFLAVLALSAAIGLV